MREERRAAERRPRDPESMLAEIGSVASGPVSQRSAGHPETLARLRLKVSWQDFLAKCQVAEWDEWQPPDDYTPDLPNKIRVWRWRRWDADEIRPMREELVANYEALRKIID